MTATPKPGQQFQGLNPLRGNEFGAVDIATNRSTKDIKVKSVEGFHSIRKHCSLRSTEHLTFGQIDEDTQRRTHVLNNGEGPEQ